jgi:hypothetical protein
LLTDLLDAPLDFLGVKIVLSAVNGIVKAK